MSDGKIFVVIGGVEVNGWSNLPKFLYLALKVQRIARQSEGCQSVEIFRIGRIFHNITIWDSPKSMKRFARSGLHGALMEDHRGVLKSSVNCGYFADAVPSRAEAVAAWTNWRDRLHKR